MNLRLDWATHQAAKFACEAWHYSGCLPASLQKRFAIGIWEDDLFSGVIVFGHGANPKIGNPYQLSIYECCELTRIAMKPGHLSPVSRCISIALKFLKNAFPKMRLVVSYADTGQGHHGGIYQATNWTYVGISKGVPSLIFKGKVWHAKALRTSYPKIDMSKVEKGPCSDKHKYLMPLDDETRSKIELLRKPYPKRAGSKDAVASPNHGEEGGSIPTPALHQIK